jgi:ribosomal protein L37E
LSEDCRRLGRDTYDNSDGKRAWDCGSGVIATDRRRLAHVAATRVAMA